MIIPFATISYSVRARVYHINNINSQGIYEHLVVKKVKIRNKFYLFACKQHEQQLQVLEVK